VPPLASASEQIVKTGRVVANAEALDLVFARFADDLSDGLWTL
jgi:hypothetical protein